MTSGSVSICLSACLKSDFWFVNASPLLPQYADKRALLIGALVLDRWKFRNVLYYCYAIPTAHKVDASYRRVPMFTLFFPSVCRGHTGYYQYPITCDTTDRWIFFSKFYPSHCCRSLPRSHILVLPCQIKSYHHHHHHHPSTWKWALKTPSSSLPSPSMRDILVSSPSLIKELAIVKWKTYIFEGDSTVGESDLSDLFDETRKKSLMLLCTGSSVCYRQYGCPVLFIFSSSWRPASRRDIYILIWKISSSFCHFWILSSLT